MKRITTLFFILSILTSCTLKKNIPVNNLPFVPTVTDFASHYNLELGSYEQWEKNRMYRFWDDTFMFDYQYDYEDSPSPALDLYYTYMLELEASLKEAQSTMNQNIKIYTKEFDNDRFETFPKQDLELDCDEYYCSEFALKGYNPSGTLLVALKGNYVITIFIAASEYKYPNMLEGFFNDYIRKTGKSQNQQEGFKSI